MDPSQYENCIGGFVYLFFKAKDVFDAIPIIEKEMENEGLSITQIEFVSQYDEIPWESEEEQKMYDSLAKEAELTGEVVWDKIFAYE